MIENIRDFSYNELAQALDEVMREVCRRGGSRKVTSEASLEEEQGLLRMSESGRRRLAEDGE